MSQWAVRAEEQVAGEFKRQEPKAQSRKKKR
jgi:hypothetical protein